MSKSKNSTIEVQGTVVSVFNPNFNYGEFATIRSKAGLNSYKISMKVSLKMRKFFEACPDLQFVLRTVAQLHWRSNLTIPDRFVKIYDRVGSVVLRICHYIDNSIPVRPLLVSQASPNVAGFSFWGLR